MERSRLLKENKLHLLIFLLLIFALSGLANQASSQTVITPVADKDTESDPDGTKLNVNAHQWTTILLKFNLSGVSGTVNNAKLRIYKNITGAATLSAKLGTDNWSEGQSTVPTFGGTISSVSMPSSTGYVELDVTSVVASEANGDDVITFGLNTSLTTWLRFSSRENAANKPQLVVTASGGGTGGPAGYSFIANEGQNFTLAQAADVAYGANGTFAYSTNRTGTIGCNNTTFGDPIPGVVKKCYVRPRQQGTIQSITLSPATSSVGVGYTTFIAYNILPFADGVNTKISWTSSNPAVATVNAFGAVKGKAAGSTTIRAISTDGTNITSNAVTVTVRAGVNSTIYGAYNDNSPENVDQYDDWLGKNTDAILAYGGESDWNDYYGSVNWQMQDLWGPLNRRVLWSIPLLVNGTELAEAARGDFNVHYARVANLLKDWRPDEPILYIRTGWEFDGGWMKWSASAEESAYIGAYRQFVNEFRKVSPRFKFDWCPNFGADEIDPETAYPGDSYVDIIGFDVYDESMYIGITNPQQRWEANLTEPNGMNWHVQFSNNHQKPMAYTEWGVGDRESGDNPYFITKMAEWFKTHKVVYANYWNSDADYRGKLSVGTRLQYAAAEYIRQFGVVQTAARAADRLEVYPNPVKSKKLTIQVDADKQGEASIIMMSPTSNKVLDVKREVKEGSNSLEIPIENLEEGIHMLIINDGNERTTRKVMISK